MHLLFHSLPIFCIIHRRCLQPISTRIWNALMWLFTRKLKPRTNLEQKTTIQRAVQIGIEANAIAIVPFIRFNCDPFHHIHKQSVKSFGECVSEHSSAVFDGIHTFNLQLHMQFLFSCNKEFHSNVQFTILFSHSHFRLLFIHFIVSFFFYLTNVLFPMLAENIII